MVGSKNVPKLVEKLENKKIKVEKSSQEEMRIGKKPRETARKKIGRSYRPIYETSLGEETQRCVKKRPKIGRIMCDATIKKWRSP